MGVYTRGTKGLSAVPAVLLSDWLGTIASSQKCLSERQSQFLLLFSLPHFARSTPVLTLLPPPLNAGSYAQKPLFSASLYDYLATGSAVASRRPLDKCERCSRATRREVTYFECLVLSFLLAPRYERVRA